uniref:Uncharacterized protein n=1 Tax=Anguilla anguilla TaxID=7936 RepID=A0A0E9X8E0_ANGAN
MKFRVQTFPHYGCNQNIITSHGSTFNEGLHTGHLCLLSQVNTFLLLIIRSAGE